MQKQHCTWLVETATYRLRRCFSIMVQIFTLRIKILMRSRILVFIHIDIESIEKSIHCLYIVSISWYIQFPVVIISRFHLQVISLTSSYNRNYCNEYEHSRRLHKMVIAWEILVAHKHVLIQYQSLRCSFTFLAGSDEKDWLAVDDVIYKSNIISWDGMRWDDWS